MFDCLEISDNPNNAQKWDRETRQSTGESVKMMASLVRDEDVAL